MTHTCTTTNITFNSQSLPPCEACKQWWAGYFAGLAAAARPAQQWYPWIQPYPSPTWEFAGQPIWQVFPTYTVNT